MAKAHSGVELSELGSERCPNGVLRFRRHLSFAAPVGVSLHEVQGHLEVKHGYGRAKLCEPRGLCPVVSCVTNTGLIQRNSGEADQLLSPLVVQHSDTC